MAQFVLHAIPVNDTFQSRLSNDIVAEQPELFSGVQFRIIEDPICYEVRMILISTDTSVKCYSRKSFPSFKASLEILFSGIMHASILKRLFETSVQPNTCILFHGQLIRRIYRLLSTCWIYFVQ